MNSGKVTTPATMNFHHRAGTRVSSQRRVSQQAAAPAPAPATADVRAMVTQALLAVSGRPVITASSPAMDAPR
ncbi:MAG TPA: hypothetical protein VFX16_38075 [Pseudonocardiaceae bacterium]|nr:hypothetical protein [Pseudonocardiaceae bacterium]